MYCFILNILIKYISQSLVLLLLMTEYYFWKRYYPPFSLSIKNLLYQGAHL